MNLLFHKPLWGHDGTIDSAIEQAIAADFQGLEGPPPTSSDFRDLLTKHQLTYIAEIVTGGDYVPDPRASPQRHLDDLKEGIEEALAFSPLKINTMCGLDAWSFSTKVAFLSQVIELADQHDILICVETHRSRLTFNPWITLELVRELPELRLTLDFSHWCVVTERLVLDHETELLEEVAKHARHIHTRVGYAQGPQVPHPGDPHYQDALEAHLTWWKRVIDCLEASGHSELTLTPEFGPDDYLHLEPFTGKKVADLWEINQWMAKYLRENLTPEPAT